MCRMLRVGEMAARTGVSIRTLHHYDQMGVLRPSGHSQAGYRLYSEQDLLGLQQVLTLRYLGFTLAQIRDLLSRSDFDLLASLLIQRGALRDRIAELERIDTVLGDLLARRIASGEWAWELVADAAAAVQQGLEQRGKKMSDYYSPDEMKQAFEKLGQEVPQEVIRGTEEEWTALIAEVRSNRHLDPASAEARALADRWNALTQATMQWYQNDPKLMASIQRNYEQNAYADVSQAPTMEDFAFIEKINKACKETNGG